MKKVNQKFIKFWLGIFDDFNLNTDQKLRVINAVPTIIEEFNEEPLEEQDIAILTTEEINAICV